MGGLKDGKMKGYMETGGEEAESSLRTFRAAQRSVSEGQLGMSVHMVSIHVDPSL